MDGMLRVEIFIVVSNNWVTVETYAHGKYT